MKRIMLWTIISDLLDIHPRIERPDGHSILIMMLTNKQFYQVCELIYEKQAFNIFINSSSRLRDDRRLWLYEHSQKGVLNLMGSLPQGPNPLDARYWRLRRTC
jgi:hypothetical protein